MKRTLLIVFSLVFLAAVIASHALASTEIKKDFVPEDPMEQHRIVATSCENPRGFRRIEMKAGLEIQPDYFGFVPN